MNLIKEKEQNYKSSGKEKKRDERYRRHKITKRENQLLPSGNINETLEELNSNE